MDQLIDPESQAEELLEQVRKEADMEMGRASQKRAEPKTGTRARTSSRSH
jgi:hypothetical protein